MDISVKPARGIVRTLPKAVRGERLVITLTLPSELSGRDFGCEIHSAQAPKDDALIAVFGTAVGAVVTYTITASQMASLDLEGQAEKAFWFVLYSLHEGEGTHHLMGTLTVLEGNVEGIETADPGLSVYVPEAPQNGTTYGRRNGAWVSVGSGGGGPVSWDDLIDTPTTRDGYGITDVPTLDIGGKILTTFLPESILGSVNYRGTWNASTNSPTLADNTGAKGQYYVVSVAGTRNLGSGSVTYAAGDWALHNGIKWERIDAQDAVSSVCGKVGVVTLSPGDLDDFDSAVLAVVNDQLSYDPISGYGIRYGDNEGGVGPSVEVVHFINSQPGSVPLEVLNTIPTTGTGVQFFSIDTPGIAATKEWAAQRGAATGSGLTMGTGKILGRSTASTGAIEEISIGGGLSLSGGTLATTGLASSGLITGGSLTMGTGKILGRSTASTGAIEEISIGSGLSLSGGTLTATGGGGSGAGANPVFTPFDNAPPTSNYATSDTRNAIPALAFTDSADLAATFVGIMPAFASFGSGLIACIKWMAASATSGAVVWGVSLERMNTDEDSDSFDTETTATTTVSVASGVPISTNITFTTIDSVAAGDPYRLKIRRIGTSGSDTMTGDAQFIAVELKSAA